MDPTEQIRKDLCEKINNDPGEREAIEEQYGQVWDTQQLQEDFKVLGFMAPFVTVIRKSDGVRGALAFQHMPRYYFNFQEL